MYVMYEMYGMYGKYESELIDQYTNNDNYFGLIEM